MIELTRTRDSIKGRIEQAQDAIFALANAHAAEIEASVSTPVTKDEYVGFMVAILAGTLADVCACHVQQGALVVGQIANELVKVEISTLIDPRGGQC